MTSVFPVMGQEQNKDCPLEDFLLKTKSDNHLLKAWHHGTMTSNTVVFPSMSLTE